MNSKTIALIFSFLGVIISFCFQETKAVPSWKKYKFGNFLLTIDPQDEMNKTYIYQEVDPGAPFPPALDTVKDFFVGINGIMGGVNGQLGKNEHIAVALESNPRYIVSLITGHVYRKNGADKGAQFAGLYPLEPDARFIYKYPLGPLEDVILEKIRPALLNAINILIALPGGYTG